MGKVVPLRTIAKPPATLAVANAVDAFLERDWTDNTRRNFSSDLRRFTQAFGDRSVADLTPVDLQGYLDGLTTRRGRQERPVSAQTYNRHYGTLSNLFGWLERQEEIERSPMHKVERRKLGERLPRPMTREQLQVFFGRIDDLRDKALFSLLHGSGLRISEALGVSAGQVEHLRKRLVEDGLETCLQRKKQQRPSIEPMFDGEAEAKLIALACSEAPAGRQRWSLRLLTDRAVALQIVESTSHETVRAFFKKRNQAAPEEDVVHPAAAQRRVRLRDGERAGGVQKAVRSEATGGVHG